MSGGGPEEGGNGDVSNFVFPTLDNTTCLSITWGSGREHTAANNFGEIIMFSEQDVCELGFVNHGPFKV